MTIVTDFEERDETRNSRYEFKLRNNASEYPISIATINFIHEENVAFVARAAACFGATQVHVIGHVPSYRELRKLSGNTSRYIPVNAYKTPEEFLHIVKREQANKLVCAEIHPDAISLWDYTFDVVDPTCIVVGNEEYGIPGPILHAADHIVYIPMPGFGYCLNTAQTANIFLHEYAKQVSCAGKK